MLLSLEFVFSLILMLVWRVVQQSGSGMGPGLLDQRTQSASTSTILNTTNQHVVVISLNLRYHLMMEKWILSTAAAHSDQYIQFYLHQVVAHIEVDYLYNQSHQRSFFVFEIFKMQQIN